MATEAPADQSVKTGERSGQRAAGRSQEIDVQDLEKRVPRAELRAREAEAELRYIVAVDNARLSSLRTANARRASGAKKVNASASQRRNNAAHRSIDCAPRQMARS